jgi:hypothetical protein
MILLALVAAVVAAPQQAEIHTLNDHHVLSAPTESGQLQLVYYEVCNASKTTSAFRWTGAGFGVDATNQLPPGLCARKRVYGSGPYIVRPEDIVFQGGGGPAGVPTWVPCLSPLTGVDTCKGGLRSVASRALASLDLLTASPDGKFVAMETVTIQLDRDATGKGGRLLVRTSDGFEHVLVAFPNGKAGVDELRKLFADNADIEIQTFNYFKDVRKLTSELLASELPGSSPVLSIPKPKEGGYERTLNVADVSQIGRIAVMLLERQGRLAVRNELSIPQPFSGH